MQVFYHFNLKVIKKYILICEVIAVLGERLSEIRKDHGNTQADLAERLGVSLFTIRAWEQEKSSPSHEMLVAICRLYNVSSDYLLGLSDLDPAYSLHRRTRLFSEEDLRKLAEYEEFLTWKKRKASS